MRMREFKDNGPSIREIEQYGREAFLEQYPQLQQSELHGLLVMSEFTQAFPDKYPGTQWTVLLDDGTVLHEYEEQKDGSYCLDEVPPEQGTYYPLFVEMKDGSVWCAGYSTNHMFAQRALRCVSEDQMEQKRQRAMETQKEQDGQEQKKEPKAKKRRLFRS